MVEGCSTVQCIRLTGKRWDMKIIAVNGSPRTKKWNTVTLLEKALEGAASADAETEIVHLYNLHFSGCISCFSCKKRNRKRNGVCAINDDLTPVLDAIREVDALIVGSPVYYGTESASTRAFIERLCFPYNNYAKDLSSLFPKKMTTALIYTMNVSEEYLGTLGYQYHFGLMKNVMARHFGSCELLLVTDTRQYNDYTKFESERFDAAAKLKRHKEIFPLDCQRAFEMGKRLAMGAEIYGNNKNEQES